MSVCTWKELATDFELVCIKMLVEISTGFLLIVKIVNMMKREK